MPGDSSFNGSSSSSSWQQRDGSPTPSWQVPVVEQAIPLPPSDFPMGASPVAPAQRMTAHWHACTSAGRAESPPSPCCRMYEMPDTKHPIKKRKQPGVRSEQACWMRKMSAIDFECTASWLIMYEHYTFTAVLNTKKSWSSLLSFKVFQLGLLVNCPAICLQVTCFMMLHGFLFPYHSLKII